MKLEYSYDYRPGKRVSVYSSSPKCPNEVLAEAIDTIKNYANFPGLRLRLEL